jgi:quinoprotein glucose dehydrogenase
LQDGDSEVRAQAANMLGEYKIAAAGEALVGLLRDESPRVRYFAALGAGKLGIGLTQLCEMLAENADQDPIIRHGGIMGLAGQPDLAAVVKEAKTHSSPSVRLAAVVALRKRSANAVSEFLGDADPLVVVEAARAIHDLPLTDAMPQLAALINRTTTDDALLRRVLNSNFRLGGAEQAAAVAAFAAKSGAPESLRIEALKMLADWANPSPRDRVLGMWRPLEKRDAQIAVAAMKTSLPGIMAGPEKVRQEGAKIAAQLGIQEVGPALVQLFADAAQPANLRADALAALVSLKDKSASDLIETALTDKAPRVRAAGRDALAQTQPASALPLLSEAVLHGETVERQAALATLGSFKDSAANEPLQAALDLLAKGAYPAEAALDLLEAVSKRKHKALADKLHAYEAQRKVDDALGAWRETLVGGDLARGKTIFFERAQVSCVRCHKVGGTGGDVGPDLSHVSKDKAREYLLEAIVHPSKAIAKGFESVALQLDDGSTLTGILKSENAKELQVMTAEGKLLSVPTDSIENRKPGKSAMPDDLPGKMTKSDLRDLVEFLSSLK